MRDWAIDGVKRVLWCLMRHPAGLRLTGLVAGQHRLFVGMQLAKRHRHAIAAAVHQHVVRGPLAGLHYPADLVGSAHALIPKLLGAYETELHPTLERLSAGSYRTLVNVGAAEGYYAVGLARQVPALRVFAFEAHPRAQAQLRALAAANGVAARVVIRGLCTPARLADCPLGPETLILMDCEGGEWDLLDPSAVPGLRTTDMLVELHPRRGIPPHKEIRARFGPTHVVQFIPNVRRDTEAYPEVQHLSAADQEGLLQEERWGHGWASLHRAQSAGSDRE